MPRSDSIVIIFLAFQLNADNAAVYDTVIFSGPPPMRQRLWPRHCVQDTWGSELHKDLKVSSVDRKIIFYLFIEVRIKIRNFELVYALTTINFTLLISNDAILGRLWTMP